ncbi:MAG: hypothetical protein ABJN52_04375 [Litorimonas sp.]
MIITDSFVHIANPRCGSTFSRKAIRTGFELAQRKELGRRLAMAELTLPNIRGLSHGNNDHHGTVSQIPQDASKLRILSSVRHPISLAISTFKLGLWMQRIQEDRVDLMRDSDVSPMIFMKYLESTMPNRWGISRATHGIGYFTAHFIAMFSKSPDYVFQEAQAGRFDLSIMEETVPTIAFHRQESLATDLQSSLSLWVGGEIARNATEIQPANVSSGKDLAVVEPDQGFEQAVTNSEKYLIWFLQRRGIEYSGANLTI